MKKIKVPPLDNNSEKAIVMWKVKHKDRIKKGDVLFSIETLKNVEDVTASEDGIFFINKDYRGKEEIDFNKSIGIIFENETDLADYEKNN